MVLLDLQKAFNTVDYATYCKKLEAMGIWSTNWWVKGGIYSIFSKSLFFVFLHIHLVNDLILKSAIL